MTLYFCGWTIKSHSLGYEIFPEKCNSKTFGENRTHDPANLVRRSANWATKAVAESVSRVLVFIGFMVAVGSLDPYHWPGFIFSYWSSPEVCNWMHMVSDSLLHVVLHIFLYSCQWILYPSHRRFNFRFGTNTSRSTHDSSVSVLHKQEIPKRREVLAKTLVQTTRYPWCVIWKSSAPFVQILPPIDTVFETLDTIQGTQRKQDSSL